MEGTPDRVKLRDITQFQIGSPQVKHGPIKVYHDHKSGRKSSSYKPDAKTRTLHDVLKVKNEISPEVLHMTQTDVSEVCWKDIAEQRRVALAEALAENEKLCKKVAELTAKNRELQEVVEQGLSLAAMLDMELGTSRSSNEDGLSIQI